MQAIPFFFDLSSPYSYLTWVSLISRKKMLEESALVLKPIPVPMGSLISSYETKGPAEIAPKREFLFREALRQAARMNIRLCVPAKLPFNPLLLLRLSLVEVSEEHQEAMITALFEGVWSDKIVMDDPEAVRSFLSQRFFSNFLDLAFEKASGAIARKALKDNLKLALEKQAFGVPTYFYQDELFWGLDSLPSFFEKLAECDLLDQEKYKEFLQQFPR